MEVPVKLKRVYNGLYLLIEIPVFNGCLSTHQFLAFCPQTTRLSGVTVQLIDSSRNLIH